NGPRTPAQCQRQSSSCRHTEHVCNKHIPTFIGPKVTWIQRAHEVDHLCQAFQRKRANQGNPCSHESQEEIDLQDCQCVPQKTEDKGCPEGGRRFTTKGEEVVFS